MHTPRHCEYSRRPGQEIIKLLKKLCLRKAILSDKGQGLVEYAFVIAFVTVLVAFCFSFSSGSLIYALSQSQSSIVGQFDRINNETQKYNK